MSRFTLLSIPALFLLSGLVSAQSIVIEPADPTTAIAVALLVEETDSCPPDPTVTRSGSLITVALGVGPCLSPPMLITHRIELGFLPAGPYDITVTDNGETAGTSSFQVLEVGDEVLVEPALGPAAGGTVVEIRSPIEHCVDSPTNPCPLPEITFDGIAATNVEVLSPTRFRATTPAHSPGAVEVTVRSGTRVMRSHAFRYYAADAPPMHALFERVLVPVYYNGEGAFGSIWHTSLTVRNSNRYPVQFWQPLVDLPMIAPVSSHDFAVPVAPAGFFLFIPRESASTTHFGALVRDVTREAEGWGTEIPLVREHEFSELAELLNVPTDARYRRMLRIYSAGSVSDIAQVTIHAMDGSQTARESVPLTSASPCSAGTPCLSSFPASAVLDFDALFPEIASLGRIGISIGGLTAPVWGFLTITNNETQQVTVISPQ
jgi:hypothetical protein